jgi:hypothetical protein
MLTIILLSWSTANCCPAVNAYRAAGYSDPQIEQIAREHAVPEWLIAYAKKYCAVR